VWAGTEKKRPAYSPYFRDKKKILKADVYPNGYSNILGTDIDP